MVTGGEAGPTRSKKGRETGPAYSFMDIPEGAPLIVSLGLGVDSVAMLIRLVNMKVAIAAILFADTGGEKPETMAYLSVINAWLRANGQPEVTVVAYRQAHGRYDTLAGNCIANMMLPSLAYGGRGCSGKFKVEVMDAHVLGKTRGPWKGPGLQCAVDAKARGLKIYRAIGYDAGPKDARRSAIPEDRHFRYVYPLRELGMDRIECIRTILREGLPVPLKSACTFCPASKPAELLWLHAVHPELFMQALAIEENAGPKLKTVEGLWRSSTKSKPGSWIKWALGEGLARRDAEGRLELIPYQGIPPMHPDEIVAMGVQREMAAEAA
jgi:hypothetical protein